MLTSHIIIIITKFSVLSSVSSNPSLDLYPRPSVREDSDYMHSMYLCFCCLFWVIFFGHIDSTLPRRIAVQFFFFFFFFLILCRLGLSCILFMCLSVSFFIIPSAPTITGTLVILKGHIFQFIWLYIIFFDW